MKIVKKILLALACGLVLNGCANLDGYRRSYTFSYVTPEGQPVGVGITLDPVTKSGK